MVSKRQVSRYLFSHGRQQGVEAGGQEDSSSKGIAEGKNPLGAMSFLVIGLNDLDREEGPSQHEDTDAQQTQHFGDDDLHRASRCMLPATGPADGSWWGPSGHS